MNKPEFTGVYKFHRIDVYKNEDGSFVSAIRDRYEENTKAESIAQSFKYATSFVERKLENIV